MSAQSHQHASSPDQDADLGRGHLIFIAVALSIVIGGLWLLSGSEGPYHPETPGMATHIQLSESR